MFGDNCFIFRGTGQPQAGGRAMNGTMPRTAALMLAAIALSGCLGTAMPEKRIIRYSYCTDQQGRVVADPAAANARGVALRCYNFIAR